LSCREELAFHGYPLRRLKISFGFWGSQLIVILIFAVEHMAGGWSWTQALFGAGVGCLLFGMAAIATGGLAVPIGLHAAWNFGDWLRGNKQSNGLWKSVVEQPVQERAQMEGMMLYVIVMVLATSAFWWWHHRLWPRRLRPVDSEPRFSQRRKPRAVNSSH